MTGLTSLLAEFPMALAPAALDGLRATLEGTHPLRLDHGVVEVPYVMTTTGTRMSYSAAAMTRRASAPSHGQRVVIVPVRGLLVPKAGGLWGLGGTPLDELLAVLRLAVADGSVSSIVLDVDSSGGLQPGIVEAARELRLLSRRKRVSAIANFRAESGAYVLAAQATDLAVSPSGSVGALGIAATYISAEKALAKSGYSVQTLRHPPRKSEADGVHALSNEALTHRAAQLRRAYDQLAHEVEIGRRVEESVIASRFGKGRSLDAGEALKVRAVDRIATLDQVIAEHLRGAVGKTAAEHEAIARAAGRIAQERQAAAKESQDRLARRWGFGN